MTVAERSIARAIEAVVAKGGSSLDAARAAYLVLAPRMRELEAQRDQARAELKEATNHRAYLEARLAEVLGHAHRLRLAWESARRGRRSARRMADIAITRLAELTLVDRDALRTRAAEALRDWYGRNAMVCEHTQLVDHGGAADAVIALLLGGGRPWLT